MNTKSMMTAPSEVYRRRRGLLASKLSRPLVAAGGRARARHYATNEYPFRAGSNYLYLGGPPIEGAALVIGPGSDGTAGCYLLRPPLGLDDAVWLGETPTDDELAGAAGLPASAIRGPDELAEVLNGRGGAYVSPPCPPTWEWLRRHKLEPANADEQLLIVDRRMCKDAHELSAVRRAASVTVAAHRAAAAAIAPGATEAQVAASFYRELVANNCDTSFTPIVSVRGEVLHNNAYVNSLSPGDLLLMDAAAEEATGYAADMTRTYPVSGSFSNVQLEVYNAVLAAQRAAIEACQPGARFRDIHDLSARVICDGLCSMGLLKGEPSALAEQFAHTLFYTHGLGHLIGLDVHDMEDFGDLAGYAPGRTRRSEFGNKFLRLDRDLVPGMVLTIEPGLYFVPAIWRNESLVGPFASAVNRKAVNALLDGGFGGIRIEDMVHVRGEDAGGPEVLTVDMPTDAESIAALVGGG